MQKCSCVAVFLRQINLRGFCLKVGPGALGACGNLESRRKTGDQLFGFDQRVKFSTLLLFADVFSVISSWTRERVSSGTAAATVGPYLNTFKWRAPWACPSRLWTLQLQLTDGICAGTDRDGGHRHCSFDSSWDNSGVMWVHALQLKTE